MRRLTRDGSGVVGTQLAFNVAPRRHRATVMDNLARAGSELSLPLFQREAIEFTRTQH
jgi:hypothetical protein